MSLDTFVYKLVKVPKYVVNEDKLRKYCEKHNCNYILLEEHHKNFPKEYIKEIEMNCFDYETAFANLGKNFCDYEFEGFDAEETTFINKSDENDMLYLKFDSIPKKKEKCRIFLFGKNVGYHHKGANDRFYKDGKWSKNNIVSTKKMLLSDWKKYFSDTPDDKDSFEKDIVKKFVEGKNFVWYC